MGVLLPINSRINKSKGGSLNECREKEITKVIFTYFCIHCFGQWMDWGISRFSSNKST